MPRLTPALNGRGCDLKSPADCPVFAVPLTVRDAGDNFLGVQFSRGMDSLPPRDWYFGQHPAPPSHWLGLTGAGVSTEPSLIWRCGRVARQRIANPSTAVRIRPTPLNKKGQIRDSIAGLAFFRFRAWCTFGAPFQKSNRRLVHLWCTFSSPPSRTGSVVTILPVLTRSGILRPALRG